MIGRAAPEITPSPTSAASSTTTSDADQPLTAESVDAVQRSVEPFDEREAEGATHPKVAGKEGRRQA